ncbi:MAG: 2,3-bisphosphoglycerate-dependent phosphoglycerate mutase, partial [Patescibacteria group bacterium]|nr:2,3-bisphosphoglycerate-dependent phosphoglycerate mutase [Patescibacteria group bacterium]
ENAALNERDYGDLTGKDKWKIREEYGEEQFLKWRRGWDTPPPNGESLKDVYSRLIPYFESTIVPQLKEEKNVIIVAHGNSLRALVKYLENISDEIIPSLEIATGEIYLYQIDKDGKVISKEIRKAANLHIPTKI